jgi:hypothetical protein
VNVDITYGSFKKVRILHNSNVNVCPNEINHRSYKLMLKKEKRLVSQFIMSNNDFKQESFWKCYDFQAFSQRAWQNMNIAREEEKERVMWRIVLTVRCWSVVPRSTATAGVLEGRPWWINFREMEGKVDKPI